MGAGASSSDGSITEREEKFFREMQLAYDLEYKPRTAERKMERKESLDFFKAKINSFVQSEPKSYNNNNTNKKSEEKRTPARAFVKRSLSGPCDPPPSKFEIGDVVKAKVDGMMFEGVIVSHNNEEDMVEVDFGEETEFVKNDKCALVMSGLDFEVGDVVQARTVDNFLYCNGKILNINHDATMDILFDGDDDDDVERNIPHALVRKIRTGRDLAKKRWQRARAMISSVRAFNS